MLGLDSIVDVQGVVQGCSGGRLNASLARRSGVRDVHVFREEGKSCNGR